MTFSGAFTSAKKFGVTADTPIYAVFFSGLMKLAVQVRITAGSKDYKIDQIPMGVVGQVYVVLSKSATKVNDENVISGPAIIEVYAKDKAPKTPGPKCR